MHIMVDTTNEFNCKLVILKKLVLKKVVFGVSIKTPTTTVVTRKQCNYCAVVFISYFFKMSLRIMLYPILTILLKYALRSELLCGYCFLISISNVGAFNNKDQCLIPYVKLSLQGMTIPGYRRGMK